MDHYATRYPTNVIDIASFLVRLSGAFLSSSNCPFVNAHDLPRSDEGSTTTNHPLLCSRTIYEMYVSCPFLFSLSLTCIDEMCLIFSQILSLPHKHIVPDAEAPKSVGTTTRPKDCQLYTRETENLLPDGDLRGCGFEEWWRGHLGK